MIKKMKLPDDEACIPKWIGISIAAFPLLICFWSWWALNFNIDHYIKMLREDGVIENLQAAVFAASSLMALHLSKTYFFDKDHLWGAIYFFLFLGLVFVVGEEISWGQRILDIRTPDWFRLQNNTQNEMNIHNIRKLKTLIVYGKIAISFAGIMLAIGGWLTGRRRYVVRRSYRWIPHPLLIQGFLSFPVYLYIRRLEKNLNEDKISYAISKLQESVELIQALTVLSFLVIVHCYDTCWKERFSIAIK